jgi:hypothetical protein
MSAEAEKQIWFLYGPQEGAQMAGSAEANHKFYNEVVDLMLGSGLNSTDVVRVLTAVLAELLHRAPDDHRMNLQGQMYNRLIEHSEAFKAGKEPVLYSSTDVMPDKGDMH